jgi:hypothetical protein
MNRSLRDFESFSKVIEPRFSQFSEQALKAIFCFTLALAAL